MRRNLILIHRGQAYERDFDAITDKVHALAPHLVIYALPGGLAEELTAAAWQHPTLTVAFLDRFRLPVRRGPILRNRRIDKLVQAEIFRSNGIPTPPSLPFTPGMMLDPILFGDFVILKPMELSRTSQGAAIRLFRRKRLAAMTADEVARLMPPGRYIVQRFVNTGAQLSYHRVLSLLGSPLYSYFHVARTPRPELSSPDAVLENAVVASNAGTDHHMMMLAPPDVVALARKVHAAFPEITSLGVDIIREEGTEKLFVLECNPGGNTWHFSAPSTAEWRVAMGRGRNLPGESEEEAGRRLFIDQFGAFDVAALALVRATEALAA